MGRIIKRQKGKIVGSSNYIICGNDHGNRRKNHRLDNRYVKVRQRKRNTGSISEETLLRISKRIGRNTFTGKILLLYTIETELAFIVVLLV